MPTRTKKKPAVTQEQVTRAKKLRAEGKSYKEISAALGQKYDKWAWNVLHPEGPTGRHRGDGAGGKPSGTVQKGKRGAGKARAAEGSVEARRTGGKRGKSGQKSPKEAPKESPAEAPVEVKEEAGSEAPSTNQPGTMTRRFGTDKPVARPSESELNGDAQVKSVPKPKDRARKK